MLLHSLSQKLKFSSWVVYMQYSSYCLYNLLNHYNYVFIDIEDKENWHGKPLGDKSEGAIKAISALIMNPGKHKLSPPAVIDDAPAIDISNVKLSEPPSYTMGEAVSALAIILLC